MHITPNDYTVSSTLNHLKTIFNYAGQAGTSITVADYKNLTGLSDTGLQKRLLRFANDELIEISMDKDAKSYSEISIAMTEKGRDFIQTLEKYAPVGAVAPRGISTPRR